MTRQGPNRSVLAGLRSATALLALVVLASSSQAEMGRGHGWHNQDFWRPGWMHRRWWSDRNGGAERQARMQRHWTFMHEGLPNEYETARSTVTPTQDNIAAGQKIYAGHCASCHGKSGLGDGEAGKSLTPSPALLAFLIQRPISVDSYLLWTISEGGKQFNTAMPAFKETLSKEDIWKVVAYMRAGFPDNEQADKPSK